MKKIAILGSTGSIGTQALEVISDVTSKARATVITANKNVKLLEEQIRKYKPELACIADTQGYSDLKARCKDLDVKITTGQEGLIEAATYKNCDMVLNSLVGISGLLPTISAICEKKEIALANKETLVTGGEPVTQLAKEMGVSVLPVDSEHSAIFQCLNGENRDRIKNIWLTASGGPFRGKKKKDLVNITKEQALKHPNWSMGAKITIDSSTLMNKGLEVIEAKWLFDVEADKIIPIVHPESVIHSMVEFTDNSVIAQLGSQDMRLPISYAINYPERKYSVSKPLNLFEVAQLNFSKPDYDTFPCLKLAFDAIKIGGLMPTVLNGANEACVELFLQDKIKYLDIPEFISKAMEDFDNKTLITVEDILKADQYSREKVYSFVK